MRRTFRILNVLIWLGTWVAVVWWTDTFGNWGVMAAQAMVPLALGGYVHLTLRPGGTAA